MRAAIFSLWLAAGTAVTAAGQTEPQRIREVRFTGSSAVEAACACLLDARRTAESQGRINFSADVAFAGADPLDATARIWMGSAHAVGRIDFTGHGRVNDGTVRRAMTLYERDLLDVTRLRRSLVRINRLGLFEPLSLADVAVSRHDDGVTADLTIPLRERKRRWWSLSGSPFPGLGSLEASISSRLPSWGRGVFEASTYFATFNLVGFVPALVRPIIPGQEVFSGFAISPRMSPLAMARQYGAAHLAFAVSGWLDEERDEPLVVPVAGPSPSGAEVLVCRPPKSPLWWLRRGARMTLAATGLLP